MLELIPPIRFRFDAEEDVAKYGYGWWVWNEVELTRLPGREMAALEEAVDMPLIAVIRGMRRGSTAATMAAMWIAMHRSGHPVAWDGFEPLVLITTWEAVPAVPLGESPDSGEAPTPEPPSSPTPSTGSATS